jgi:hypothetical protein
MPFWQREPAKVDLPRQTSVRPNLSLGPNRQDERAEMYTVVARESRPAMQYVEYAGNDRKPKQYPKLARICLSKFTGNAVCGSWVADHRSAQSTHTWALFPSSLRIQTPMTGALLSGHKAEQGHGPDREDVTESRRGVPQVGRGEGGNSWGMSEESTKRARR